MKVFYNEETKGFYQDDIHRTIPDGSIEISDEKRNELLSKQSDGMIITVINGTVEAVDKEPLTDEQIEEIVGNKRRSAYEKHSDPLFFKEQRGEVEEGTWKKEVEGIKDAYTKEKERANHQ